MHIQLYHSPLARLTRPWHLALIVVLLVCTVLPHGKVLVAGGYINGGYLVSTEMYDPGANT